MARIAPALPIGDPARSRGRVKVWDPIVRIFHWTVAGGVIANLTFLKHQETPHIYVGYAVVSALAIRILWGVVGRRHARFSSFVPGPGGLLRYVRAMIGGREQRYVGHNPAGAAMIIVLMLLLATVGTTGWMMGLDRFWSVGWVETLHEAGANALIAAVALHVIGAIVESIRHRENLPLAMVPATNGHPREAMLIMRLLLIEDNDRLAGLIRDGLSQQGFAVDCLATVADAELALQVSAYDLLLLDLGLPDGDGLDLVREVRRRKDAIPILVLTARGGLDDRVTGLDAGADDYLVKPFQIPELAARCRALLRRPGASLGTQLVAGNVVLDTVDRTVEVAGSSVDATPREVSLLEVLLRRAGHVVAKSSLENTLYAMDAEVTPNALEASVSRLRKRLASGGADVQIRTVHGVGYALFAPAIIDG